MKQLDYHNIFQKIETMEATLTQNAWTDRHTLDYIKVDKTIAESMLHAERTITRRHTGTYEWSVALSQSIYVVRYWKLRIKQAKASFVSPHILQSTHASAGLPVQATTPTSLQDLIQQLRQAKQHLETSKKSAAALRESYLSQLAEAIILKQHPFLDKPQHHQMKQEWLSHEIQELIKRERRRRMF
jgi:hypothetical protein